MASTISIHSRATSGYKDSENIAGLLTKDPQGRITDLQKAQISIPLFPTMLSSTRYMDFWHHLSLSGSLLAGKSHSPAILWGHISGDTDCILPPPHPLGHGTYFVLAWVAQLGIWEGRGRSFFWVWGLGLFENCLSYFKNILHGPKYPKPVEVWCCSLLWSCRVLVSTRASCGILWWVLDFGNALDPVSKPSLPLF